jgi:hypothetical protein
LSQRGLGLSLERDRDAFAAKLRIQDGAEQSEK